MELERDKGEQNKRTDYYDLTQKASQRSGDKQNTTTARQAENEDINEETSRGNVDSSDDDIVENKIWTSSSDE